MPKRIVKRNNFDGGFIVTGKGDSAVITPRTEKPKPRPKLTRPKKQEQEKREREKQEKRELEKIKREKRKKSWKYQLKKLLDDFGGVSPSSPSPSKTRSKGGKKKGTRKRYAYTRRAHRT